MITFHIARISPICVLAVLCLPPLARAQAGKTMTATANMKTSGAAAAPVSVVVDRFSTDRERDELLAALEESGTEGVPRGLLLTRPPIGTLKVGNESTAITFGVIMVMTFTGSISAAEGGAAETRTMLTGTAMDTLSGAAGWQAWCTISG